MDIQPVLKRASLVLLCVATLGGCKKDDELAQRRLSEAMDKVVSCKREVNDLTNQVALLKKQLAQAIAGNANKIQLTDPEIINLIADLRGGKPMDTKETLNMAEASKVIFQGAKAMQVCYERALKKNQSLQYQAGVGVTLDVTVKSAGTVEGVEVSPSVDREMTACIKTAAMRWKFPSFTGEPVTVSQKFTLTPKT